MISDSCQPRWCRQGLLLPVKPGHPSWKSHAQIPTVLPLSERLWRIYFGARDGENRSRILAVDIDPGDDMRILAEHFEPLLDLGPPGTFDREGMVPATAIRVDGEVRLYYGALFVRRDVPGQATIGLAISDDGLRFRRAFAGPVHGLGPYDPLFSSVPNVRRTSDGFRMWYIGGTQWRDIDGDVILANEIRTTHSCDGKVWDIRSQTALAPDSPEIVGFGRPWIIETDGGLRLLTSRRGAAHREAGKEAYHLVSVAADARGSFSGAAEPLQFENPPREDDFDSWMQSYACIAPYKRDLVMFYNGNDFGREGFGWARLPGGASRAGALS
jgi:hypothetical protein